MALKSTDLQLGSLACDVISSRSLRRQSRDETLTWELCMVWKDLIIDWKERGIGRREGKGTRQWCNSRQFALASVNPAGAGEESIASLISECLWSLLLFNVNHWKIKLVVSRNDSWKVVSPGTIQFAYFDKAYLCLQINRLYSKIHCSLLLSPSTFTLPLKTPWATTRCEKKEAAKCHCRSQIRDKTVVINALRYRSN